MSVRKRLWTGNDGVPKSAWQADYVDATGKRRRKNFGLKRDAEAFERRASTEVADGVHVADRATVTVREAGRLWVDSARSAGLERSTVDQYRQHVDLHIVPFVGDAKLSTLSVPSMRAFKDTLRAEGRSPAMVKKVLVSFGSLLAEAQELGLASRNPVRDMSTKRRSRDSRQEQRTKAKLKIGVDIPSPEEIRTIISGLKGHWRPLLMTAIFTGLRASELRGLKWSEVDLGKCVVHVRRRADRYHALGHPKSGAGHRQVPLPPVVANTLREWKLICPKADTGKKDQNGVQLKVLDLVFPNGKGKIESLGNIVRRGLQPAQVRSGLATATGELDAKGKPILKAKYTGMHSLRHFYASWCINSKEDGGLEMPPKAVQERLGHQSIVMTMDVYGHLFPKLNEDNMAAAEAMLLGESRR